MGELARATPGISAMVGSSLLEKLRRYPLFQATLTTPLARKQLPARPKRQPALLQSITLRRAEA